MQELRATGQNLQYTGKQNHYLAGQLVSLPVNKRQFKVITPEAEVAAIRDDWCSLQQFLSTAVTISMWLC